MSEARLVAWSRWHSVAAALVGPVILAGVVLRAAGVGAPASTLATTLTFGGGAVALAGAIVGFWSMGSSTVPGSEAQRQRVRHALRRGEAVAVEDRDTARRIALNELRTQPTQVWTPLTIGTVAFASTPLLTLTGAFSLVVVLFSVGLSVAVQRTGRRCRRVAATP